MAEKQIFHLSNETVMVVKFDETYSPTIWLHRKNNTMQYGGYEYVKLSADEWREIIFALPTILKMQNDVCSQLENYFFD